MTIYQRIQELAKRRKISIRQIELDLGYANGSLRKWHSSAPTDRLSQVAKYLGTTPDFLILGYVNQDEPKPKIHVDLDNDEDVIMTYQGKPIADEDMELIKRILRGK